MKRLRNKFVLIIILTAAVISLGSGYALAAAQQKPIEKPKVEYKAEDKRDPFGGPKIEKEIIAKVEGPLPNLNVQGLLWGGNFPQAIINNKVLKIGDMIDGAQVVDIDRGGVLLLFEGRKYNLPAPAAAQKTAVSKTQGGRDEKDF